MLLKFCLAEFKHWIEVLQENSSEDGDMSKKFRQALAHMSGKIRGNQNLYKHFGEKMLKRLKLMIEDLDNGKSVSATKKISLCSEIKESLTTLELENYKLNKNHE